MAVNGVKIPAKHYVGMVKRQTEKIPLGFITPWGEDAAAKKRMDTVDSWSKQGYYGGKSLPAMVIENTPMAGFKMTTDIRSSSYGGVDKWRIEDPRGFELEITSHNLAQLLSVGMIDRGEIMDSCVWARNGQQNVLLSTNTEEYKEAVQNTAVANMKAEWKDVKIGNKILLQNNITGVWLGRMHNLTWSPSHRDEEAWSKNEIVSADKSQHVIYVETADSEELHIIASPKLAAIVESTTMTDADAELFANRKLTNPKCRTVTNGYHDVLALTVGSVKANKTMTFELTPTDISTVAELYAHVKHRRSNSAIFLDAEDKGIVKFYDIRYFHHHNNTANAIGAEVYLKDRFAESELVPHTTKELNDNYWNRRYYTKQLSYEFQWTDACIGKLCTLTLKLQTKTGNIIRCTLQ